MTSTPPPDADMLLLMLERALSQADDDEKGPSVPVVRAPILEHPAQYQLKYQVTSAAEMTGQDRATAHNRAETSLYRDVIKIG